MNNWITCFGLFALVEEQKQRNGLFLLKVKVDYALSFSADGLVASLAGSVVLVVSLLSSFVLRAADVVPELERWSVE